MIFDTVDLHFLREEREAYEAYAFSRDSGDVSEDARGASAEETRNDVAFSDAAFSDEASRADEGDASGALSGLPAGRTFPLVGLTSGERRSRMRPESEALQMPEW